MNKKLKKEKTLIRFEYNDGYEYECNFYCEVEGDYSSLDKTFMNFLCPRSCDKVNSDKLYDLLIDYNNGYYGGEFKIKKLKEPTRDWDHYITVGISNGLMKKEGKEAIPPDYIEQYLAFHNDKQDRIFRAAGIEMPKFDSVETMKKFCEMMKSEKVTASTTPFKNSDIIFDLAGADKFRKK